MSPEEFSVHVHFGKPMPLFPLDTVAILPQQVIPLHIFEPRYCAMVKDVLDSSGQFAFAVFSGNTWKSQYHGRPPIRRALCISQIVQHEKTPQGTYHLLMQGICRAQVLQELPASEDRLYRAAMLAPTELRTFDDSELGEVRERLGELLTDESLNKLAATPSALEWINNEEIPSHALLELLSLAFVTQPIKRYRLLAEADPTVRAGVIVDELSHLRGMIHAAMKQQPQLWPKGCSWN